MPATTDQFRKDFPEFSDTNVFADSTVNYWLVFAQTMIDPLGRFGSDVFLTMAQELFIAHHIVIEAMAAKTVAVGGLPGISKGAVSAESPGEVSVSYDTNSTLETEAGHWNLTVYGTRLIRMLRLAGSGPVHIGATPTDPNGLDTSLAWGGPPTGWGGTF